MRDGKILFRKFIGFFKGQFDLIDAESNRRHISLGTVVREIFDLGIPKYKKNHKLPPTYPDNKIDFTNKNNF